MRALALTILLFAGLALAEPRIPQAGLDACLAGPEWTGWSVRIGIVLHADGGWSFAMEPADVPNAVRVRECFDASLRVTLDEAPPPARTKLIVKQVKGPAAPKDRVAELKQRFDSMRDAISRCVLAATPVGNVDQTISLTLTLDRVGNVSVGAGPEASFAVACTHSQIGTFAPGKATVEVELRVQGAGQTVRPDGSRGALCRWGQREPPPLGALTPAPCAAGLTCCASGGAAGSSSVCMDVGAGRCPMYP
jgi:hypothetical protein